MPVAPWSAVRDRRYKGGGDGTMLTNLEKAAQTKMTFLSTLLAAVSCVGVARE